MGKPGPTSKMGVPSMLLPFTRLGTDIVERQLDIFPYPNSNINSSNASQIMRFDFPPSVMLDCTAQGLELDFMFKVVDVATMGSLSNTLKRVQAFPGECCGHLINTIRTYINNEMVEETLNFGQLSSIIQQLSTNTIDSSCMEQQFRGRYRNENTFEYAIRADGQMLMGGGLFQVSTMSTNASLTTVNFNAGALTQIPTGDATGADNSGLFLTTLEPSTTSATVTSSALSGNFIENEILTFVSPTQLTVATAQGNSRVANYYINGLGYNIPQSTRGFPLWKQKLDFRNGRRLRIPISLPGQMFNQRQGVIPLSRLPKVRMEITFNPAAYVLFAPTSNTAVNTQANYAAQDYLLSDLKISAMYGQAPSLVAMYDSGNWEYSLLGYSYYTSPVPAGNSQLIPISIPFKSTRYLLAIFSNPAQYTGLVNTSTTAGLLPLQSGTQVSSTGFPNGGGTGGFIGAADSTRWSNFYGFGGCYGGAEYVDNTSNFPGGPGLQSGTNSLGCFQGQNASVYPTNINFQQNNEWVFQQDLQSSTQFFRELCKCLPAVKRSTFITVDNFPGVRFVLAINLQAPELSDQFICGNRAAQGQSLGYLKLYTSAAIPISACVMQSWICYDRMVRVQQRSGLTVVDY